MTDPQGDTWPQQFVGTRVLARPFRDEDAAAFLEAQTESRDHLVRWLGGWDEVHSLADALQSVRKRREAWGERLDLVLALFDRRTQRFVGEGGLGPNWEKREFEFGFWLRPSAEGHGYMTEANQLVCDWAFDGLSARRVFMSCDARNLRSAAVAQRLGLRELAPQHLPDESRTLRSFEMAAAEYPNAPWRQG